MHEDRLILRDQRAAELGRAERMPDASAAVELLSEAPVRAAVSLGELVIACLLACLLGHALALSWLDRR